MPEDDSVSVNTGLFGLRLTGPNSLIMFLFITIFALMAMITWENQRREREHEELSCLIKLNLYMNAIPRGEQISWEKVPMDLYACIPSHFYRQDRHLR
jgi:hypothetical protein